MDLLEFNGLYKKESNVIINNMILKVEQRSCASIECNDEVSDLLISLILGKTVPSKGEIYIDGKNNRDYLRHNLKDTGIIFINEGFYERLTVEEYMKFYRDVINPKVNYKEIMLKLALLDIGKVKLSKLTYSQKRRLSFARERLKQLKLLIFQEPILNMDKDSAKIIIENIEELRSLGTAILTTSVSFKDTVMLGGKAYVFEDYGLKEVEDNHDINEAINENIEDKKPIYKIEKIPAKIDDRILLFDPIEIDYVESEQGISNLSIRGEKFPCTISLVDLENRLKHFGFFRCHRSYLVNLQRVREVITWTRNSYSLSLEDKNKSNIPLSKGRMQELKDVLNL